MRSGEWILPGPKSHVPLPLLLPVRTLHETEGMLRMTSVLFCALAMACSNVPIQLPAPGGPTGTAMPGGAAAADEVVRYTNDARSRNGLPVLRANSRLMEAARIHAEQMAAAQRSAHTISGARYPTMQDRLAAVGYNYMQAAENVAWNQRSAA